MFSPSPSPQPARALALLAILALGSPAVAQAEATDAEPFRIDRRANQFTTSGQDRVALAQDAAGNSIVVWQSKRQEDGNYGIFARRFDALGVPLGDEVHVNATTASMQMQPAVTVDDQGGVWFAWRSFGQDGDHGAIVARRFDPALTTATAEVVVNQVTAGEQTDVVLAPQPDGGAFLAWQSQGTEPGFVELFGRRLAGDGTVAGDAFRIDGGSQARSRRASVAADSAGRTVVAWDSADAAGVPTGIRVRTFAPDGSAGDEVLVDQGIEPALALAPHGDVVLAYFQTEGDGYGVRLRRGDRVISVPVEGDGYTSGLAVDVDEAGDVLLAWSHFADGRRNEAGLFAQLFDAELAPRADAFRVTRACEGRQMLAAVTGTQRIARHADGRMAFAWSGDAGLGDASGAHLTLLVPDGLEVATVVPESELSFAPLEDAARPHEPPTYDPANRSKPETDMNRGRATDFDFLAVTNTGWTPPDPHMAAGPDHVVVMTNGEIAFFDDSGTNTFRDEIEDSFGFWGAQGATGFVFDPEVLYDPHTGRFMAMAVERGSSGYYLLAISDDSDPNGTWYKYRIDAAPYASDTDIDSPQIAVDQQAIYLSADFFGPDKLNIVIIDKSSVINGGTPTITSTNITGTQSHGFPVTYDIGVPAQYLIGFNFSTSTKVKMWALTNPLTAPTLTSIDVTVPSYSHPEDPPQQGTTTRPETFEARFWSAVYRNGRMWATHHVNGTRVRQRWYEFDMQGWPTSGSNPVMIQSGEIDLGGTIRTFFGSIWVDANGTMAMTYARSSPTEYISMERTWRAAGDPLGTTRTPVSVIGSSSSSSSRWGDYSCVVSDPQEDGVFWAHHEYRTSSWRTRVAYFDTGTGGSDPIADFSGTPTSGNEDLFVAFTDLSTGTGLSGWDWSFGDGGTSTLPSPSHTYVDPGTYTVSLTVTGTNGTDNETKAGYIVVLQDPIAQFVAAPTSGDEDLFVVFTDQSSGTGLSGWNWDFGDGGTSILQNPSYTYVDPGTYTVALTVTGVNGSDTMTKNNYIVVNDVFNATATPYNGSGINPNILTSVDLPILGTSWQSQIDGGSVGATGFTFLFGYSAPISGIFTGVGELLIDISTPWQFTSLAGGGGTISNHSVLIPSDPAFAGFHSYVQGFLNNVGGSGLLTNAYDLELGY